MVGTQGFNSCWLNELLCATLYLIKRKKKVEKSPKSTFPPYDELVAIGHPYAPVMNTGQCEIMLWNMQKAFSLMAADVTTGRHGLLSMLQLQGWTHRSHVAPGILSGPFPTRTRALGLGPQIPSQPQEVEAPGYATEKKSVALHMQTG